METLGRIITADRITLLSTGSIGVYMTKSGTSLTDVIIDL